MNASLTRGRRGRGGNRLETHFTTEGKTGEPYPSGNVQSRWIVGAGLRMETGSYGSVTLDGFFQAISNVNNDLGASENVLGVQLGIHLRPPTLTNR